MRKLQIWFAATVAIMVLGCEGKSGLRGSGKVISEARTVAGFTAVSLRGEGQLVIDENGTESLTIAADDNLLPYLTSEVIGNQLILGIKDHTDINPSKDVVYKLNAKDLNTIELAGSGAVEAKGIHTDKLKVLIGGSGSMSAAGIADRQEVTLAGSGEYHAGDLQSRAVTIGVMGSGGAVVNASEKLDAVIAGSGSIKYSGDPAVTQHVMGSGEIQKISR